MSKPSASTLLVNLAGAVLFAALFLSDQRAAGARVERRTQVRCRICAPVLDEALLQRWFLRVSMLQVLRGRCGAACMSRPPGKYENAVYRGMH